MKVKEKEKPQQRMMKRETHFFAETRLKQAHITTFCVFFKQSNKNALYRLELHSALLPISLTTTKEQH